jgi:hypothetical protein
MDERVIEVLERILQSCESMQKQEFDIIITSVDNDKTIHFDNPIPIKNAKIALKLFSMYYSIPNVNEDNNQFTYDIKKGKDDWETIHFKLDPGSYEVSSLAARIRELMDANDPSNNEISSQQDIKKRNKPFIKFRVEPATMKCIIDIPENYSVDFESFRSIGGMLGFYPQVYTAGTHISRDIVNINPVNSLLLHCDLASGCSINGKASRCVYSFDPKVPPGYKITEEPTHLVFYPIEDLTHINKLRIWLTDENGKKVDTRREKMTVTMTVKV